MLKSVKSQFLIFKSREHHTFCWFKPQDHAIWTPTEGDQTFNSAIVACEKGEVSRVSRSWAELPRRGSPSWGEFTIVNHGEIFGASLKWGYPNSWMISNRKSQRKGIIWGYPYDSGNLHVDIDPLLWMMADLGVDIILGHLQLPSFTQIHTCQAY